MTERPIRSDLARRVHSARPLLFISAGIASVSLGGSWATSPSSPMPVLIAIGPWLDDAGDAVEELPILLPFVEAIVLDARDRVEAAILARPDEAMPLLVDGSDRWWGRRLIKRMGDDALPAITDALGSPRPAVRAQALGLLPANAALLPCVRALSDPDANVREQALSVLDDLDDALNLSSPLDASEQVGDLVAQALDDPVPAVRGAAIQALGGQRHAPATAALVEALHRHDDHFELVTWALSQMETPEADAAVLEAPASPGKGPSFRMEEVTRRSSQGEQAFVAQLGGPLERRALSVLESRARAPLRLPPHAADRLVELAHGTARPERRLALRLLAFAEDERLVAVARAALAGPDGVAVIARLDERGLATESEVKRALGTAGMPIEDLRTLLRRRPALAPGVALERTRDRDARTTAMITSMSRLPAGERRAVLQALLIQGDHWLAIPHLEHAGEPALLTLLASSPVPSHRRHAAVMLTRRPAPGVTEALRRCFDGDADADVRAQCGLALVGRGAPGMGPLLARRLDRLPARDRAFGATKLTLRALEDLADPANRPALKRMRLRARVRFGPGAIDVHWAASAALAVGGDTSIVPDLLAFQRKGYQGDESIELLGSCGPEGLPHLLRFAGRPELRTAAIHGLAHCTDARAGDRLAGFLDAEDRVVRLVAAHGLARRDDLRAVPPLLEVLHDAERPFAHHAAARALADLTCADVADDEGPMTAARLVEIVRLVQPVATAAEAPASTARPTATLQ